jgi:3alpha(or 20beta)-hydroxysteroid dehydrogenase
VGKLDGKVALISGAARGQGEAEARLFVAEGASVVLGDVLEDRVKAVAADLGERAVGLHLDVTDEDSWKAAVATAEREFGRLDVLVNNAGVAGYSPIADMPLEDYMRIVRVNQIGPFLGMKAAIPLLQRDGGAIVNTSSIAGVQGFAGTVAYASSKWAVRGMSKVAALELAGLGIRVNSIYPGSVDTPMLYPDALDGALIDMSDVIATIPMKRMASAEEIASLVLFLSCDDSSYCTGGEFVVDGGVTAGQAASG